MQVVKLHFDIYYFSIPEDHGPILQISIGHVERISAHGMMNSSPTILIEEGIEAGIVGKLCFDLGMQRRFEPRKTRVDSLHRSGQDRLGPGWWVARSRPVARTENKELSGVLFGKVGENTCEKELNKGEVMPCT